MSFAFVDATVELTTSAFAPNNDARRSSGKASMIMARSCFAATLSIRRVSTLSLSCVGNPDLSLTSHRHKHRFAGTLLTALVTPPGADVVGLGSAP